MNLENSLSTQLSPNQIQPYSSVQKILSKLPLFEKVKRENGVMNFKKILKKIRKYDYQAGTQIFNLENRRFVYILSGSVDLIGYRDSVFNNYIEVYSNQQQNKIIKTLIQNQYFGDREYINDQYTLTQAIAREYTTVYQLPLQLLYITFKGVIYFPDISEKVNILSQVTIFKNVQQKCLERLAYAIKNVRFIKNIKVYQQDTEAKFAYIVIQGQFQLVRRINDKNKYMEVQILTINKYQTLGVEEVLLNQKYSDSVHCVSVFGELLRIEKEHLKNSIDINKILKLCRSKKNWKNQRMEMFQRTYTAQYPSTRMNQRNIKSSDNQRYKKTRTKTQGDIQQWNNLEISRSQSKKSTITNKKKSDAFRSEQQYIEFKVNTFQKRKLQMSTNIFQIEIPNKPIQKIQKNSRNLSELLLSKFLNKKQKIQNKIILDYLSAKPPELVFNPQKEYTIMKPLYVKQSSAILNKKKTLYQLKRKFFKPIIPIYSKSIEKVLNNNTSKHTIQYFKD